MLPHGNNSKSDFTCPCYMYLLINGFSDGENAYHTTQMTTRGPEALMRLWQREYHV